MQYILNFYAFEKGDKLFSCKHNELFSSGPVDLWYIVMMRLKMSSSLLDEATIELVYCSKSLKYTVSHCNSIKLMEK